MKRMHIHITVNELSESINFYSTLFGAPPSLERADYAKWNLADPAVNFAISQRGHTNGINHLGIQVDSDAELEEISQRLNEAAITSTKQDRASCCYAQSNKHWVLDPQDIAWESFHTLGETADFGSDIKTHTGKTSPACCIPSDISATNFHP